MTVERTDSTLPVPAGSNFWFTVCTPTYNRAHLLPRVYHSLQEQTCRSFEWVIVDDGSTDDTEIVVRGWQADSGFPISFIRQPNSGKHVAVNRAVRSARGYFIAILDDDDVLPSDALDRCLYRWHGIPVEERAEFVGVTGLRGDLDGRLKGKPLPSEFIDCDSFRMRMKYPAGDRWGVQRADVMRRFPFPDEPGFVAESLVWNRIAQQFRQRYCNEVFALGEYLADGVSAQSVAKRAGSPQLAALHYREYLSYDGVPLPRLLRAYINYVRFSRHARVPLSRQVYDVRSVKLWLPCLPIGTVLYMLDKWLMRRQRRS